MSLSLNHIDFQPYLLPNTDIWSLSEDKSLLLLDYLKSRGIKQIFCTPPIKQDSSSLYAESLNNIFDNFKKQYSGNIQLRLAARYRLDGGFLSLFENNEFLSIGRELIVDVSPIKEEKDYLRMLERILDKGYIPVIVQPERTIYWGDSDYSRLKELGCKLILNLYSLFGYNGDYALMYSRELLFHNMYDYLFSGIEDTKIMHYSQNFTLDESDILLKELKKLEDNGRYLWSSTENV